MKRFISVLVLVCLMAAMLTVPAFAEEYYAPTQADFEKVLSDAVDGDVIKLAQGEYKMPASAAGKSLTIQGAGSDKTMVKLPADFSGSVSFVDVATENQGGAALPPSSSGGAAPQAKLLAPKSGTVPTASVGGVEYSSIQEAVDNAVSGQTVYVTSSGTMDITAGVTNADGYYTLVNVGDGKSITIDLNGCSIYVDGTNLPADLPANMMLAVIAVDAGSSLILKDSVGSGSISMDTHGSSIYSLIYNYEGTMDIQSGNYSADGLVNGRGMIYDGGQSQTTISGGNFNLINLGSGDNGSPWVLNASGKNDAFIKVSGGTFNDKINEMHWQFEVKLAADKMVKANGNGTWSVVDAVASVDEEVYAWGPEYQIYPIGYASLEEAVKHGYGADDVDRINLVGNAKLSSDITSEDEILVYDNKDVTLDLNGKNITGEVDSGLFAFGNGSKLTVIGNGNIKNESGSIFSGTPTKAQLLVAGGTWYGFDPSNYLAPGATVREIDDNVWMVNAPPVAPGGNKPAAANPYAVPATGDNSNVPLWGLLFIVFAAVAVVTGKKRKA